MDRPDGRSIVGGSCRRDRSLRPEAENVLLTPEGKVVITDFGLARHITESGFSENAIAGSAPWMSPEQIAPVFGPIDHRTDIYGLGAVLYTLLTGQAPFNATRLPDVLSQIVSQQPEPPSKLRSGIVSSVDSLCMACLQKRCERRPATAEAFLAEVRHRD
jgi:serine/threonine protein kinase